jgi:hypothetical protein
MFTFYCRAALFGSEFGLAIKIFSSPLVSQVKNSIAENGKIPLLATLTYCKVINFAILDEILAVSSVL